MLNLNQNVEIRVAKAHQTAATANFDSGYVDVANRETVRFIVPFVTGHASAHYASVSMADTTTGSGVKTVVGSKVLATTAKPTVVIEIIRPRKRYVKAVVVRGSVAVGPVLAELAGPTKAPVSAASAINMETHLSPSSGTI
jgi:hypothetical protein